MGDTLPAAVARRIAAAYIESGRIDVGGRLPSVRELRHEFGVSGTTVANALSLLATHGLVRKVHGKGTFVTGRTAGPPRADLQAIGYVMPTVVSEGVLMPVYAGVERASRRYGWDVMVATADYDYDTERRQVARFRDAGCRGIVLYPVTRTASQLRGDYLKSEFRDLPIVLMDIAYPEQARSQVVFDNYRGGYDMTEFLLGEGHRRIAFVSSRLPQGRESMHRSTRDRYRGYIDALRYAGIAPRPEDLWSMELVTQRHESEAECLLRAWLQSEQPATAVIGHFDGGAYDLIQTAHRMGIRVPEDLRVVGFDNMSFGPGGNNLFPTTAPDFGRAGELAVELLAQHISGEVTMPTVFVLPVPLRIPRGATRWDGTDGNAMHVAPQSSQV